MRSPSSSLSKYPSRLQEKYQHHWLTDLLKFTSGLTYEP